MRWVFVATMPLTKLCMERDPTPSIGGGGEVVDVTPLLTDNDGDGLTELGGDCDDHAADVHPGAEEETGDGTDNDCDDATTATEFSLDLSSAPRRYVGTPQSDPNATGETAGTSIAVSADITGDDLGDLLVGAPYRPEGGGIYLMSGTQIKGGRSGKLNVLSLAVYTGEASSEAGTSLSTGRDVNGDGFHDFVVGAPGFAAGGQSSAGAAYLVLGPTEHPGLLAPKPGTAEDRPLSDASADGLVVIGTKSGLKVGASVAMGDLDGDAFADLAIGAPDYAGDTPYGAVGLMRGSDSLISGELPFSAEGAEDGLALIVGETTSDRAGSSVAFLPALDAGTSDWLLIGAREATYDTQKQSGAAYLVSNTESSSLAVGDPGVLRLNGARAREYAGTTVADGGDLDGDGLSDALIGTLTVCVHSSTCTGRMYMVSGGTIADFAAVNFGTELSLADADTIFEWTSGHALEIGTPAKLGDLTEDGLDDLAVGVPDDATGGVGAGAVFIAAGSATLPAVYQLDNALVKIIGEDPYDRSGSAVVGGEDLDGDGRPELVVGAPGYGNRAGAVYVLSADEILAPIP